MTTRRRLSLIALELLVLSLPAAAQDQAPTRNPLRNALVGAGIGAAGGAVFGALAPESCCVPLGWERSEATLLWTGIGAAGGGLIGLITGQMGKEPLPAWKTALIGGGLGGAAAAIPALLAGSTSDAGYIVGFGAGVGLLVGGVVGVISQGQPSSLALAGRKVILAPSPDGLRVGWRWRSR